MKKGIGTSFQHQKVANLMKKLIQVSNNEKVNAEDQQFAK